MNSLADFMSVIYYFIINSVVDMMLYIMVDMITKTPIVEAGDSQSEKRYIWNCEAAVLFLLSVIIHFVHHTPYLLILMAVSTVIYTQMMGKVDFRHLWTRVESVYDEFEQHEESMEKMKELKNQQQIAQQISFQAMQNANRMQAASGMPDFNMPSEAWYPADQVGKSRPMVSEPSYAVSQEGVPVPAQLRQRQYPMPRMAPMYPQPVVYSRLPDHYTNNGPRYGMVHKSSELARKPLRTAEPKKDLSLTSKVMSALGMDPYCKHPPGLNNAGQNLCFMNSVLQCLANSPGLVSALEQSLGQQNNNKPMVSELKSLFKKLLVKPGSTDVKVVDTHNLRNSLSELSGSIVENPNHAQQQQDIAEFLMWTLQQLHSILNVDKQAAKNHNGSVTKSENHASDNGTQSNGSPRAKLQMLKYIYGDLSPKRIKELKRACRQEIEKANGLENCSYAEPIQRLSDLEWLAHKEQNNSPVDDIFTGQLVESQHCTACNRISVGIQAFNILPVPIVESRSFNGITYLEDCLTKFGTIENLSGADGLRCQCANSECKIQDTAVSTPSLPQCTVSRVTMGRKLATAKDNFLQQTIMSPIPMKGDTWNDSGVGLDPFKTSTPIQAPVVSSPRLTEGQKRSLLRQLPECLVLQLMRFSLHQGNPRKIQQPLHIPLQHLDLTDQVVDKVMKREDLTTIHSSHKYNLYGVCVHLGGEASMYGHYMAYVQAVDGLWYKFDDESVTAVNMEYELTTRTVRENAYLLFYKKSHSR